MAITWFTNWRALLDPESTPTEFILFDLRFMGGDGCAGISAALLGFGFVIMLKVSAEI